MQQFTTETLAIPALPATADLLRRARIVATYLARHGRWPALDEPRLFTEWVQWRKLHDRNAAMPAMIDKLHAKDHVAALLGREWTTPTLWHGDTLPDFADLPPAAVPFVVKSRHGCNQRAFFRNADELTRRRWQATQAASRRWLTSPYGGWLDEWAYAQVPRGIMAEAFVGDADGTLPIDYKVYVFGGEPAFVQVHYARERAHHWGLYDIDWRAITPGLPATPRPSSLGTMIDAARTLGRAFDFVRADFYEVAGRPRFGELTFYPGSGLDPFDPPELDAVMGRLWSAARPMLGHATRGAGCGTVGGTIAPV